MLPLALFVALLWALYPFILKRAGVDPVVTWALFSIVAAVASVAVALAMKKNLLIGKKSIPIVLASLMGPVLGMLLYIYLIYKCPKTTLVVALAFTSPLFAAVLGHLAFGEKLALNHYIGILLIVVGILFLVWKRR